jgi:hypothetical protein
MMPTAWHSAPLIILPVRVSSMVRDSPNISRMIQGPVMLPMPALISGWPMVVPGWPTRTSARSATWKADPAATPLRAATSGLESVRIRR